MQPLGRVNHKEYGGGKIIGINRTENNIMRVFIVWDNQEKSSVIGGWYLLEKGGVEIEGK